MSADSQVEVDADRLIAEGHRLEAIDMLMDANRRHPDPEIETRLVQLRHDAYQDLVGVEGRATWPPDYDDPFPGRKGLIEVDASELDAELIGGALRHHSCLMVRGLLDQQAIDRLTDDMDEAITRHDEWQSRAKESPGEPPPEPSPWFRFFEPNPEYEVTKLDISRRTVTGRVAAADSPRTLFDVIDGVGRSGLLDHAADYLGTRPVLPANKVAMGKVAPGTRLGWHQETKVFGEAVRAFNTWIAVQPCGRGDAPGLNFYAEKLPGLIPGEERTPGSYMLTPESVASYGWASEPVCPPFEAGDALLFDEWLMHRTEFAPKVPHERYSFEFWMFAADGIAANRGPLVC
jgi:hypothetical protein